MSKLEPYTSGYMKPPKHAQFKKGKSGNPKGRPRKPPEPFTILNKVLKRKISVAGMDKKITLFDALMHKLRERALKGDVKAIGLMEQIVGAANKHSPPVIDHKEQLNGAKRRFAIAMGLQVTAEGGVINQNKDDDDVEQ